MPHADGIVQCARVATKVSDDDKFNWVGKIETYTGMAVDLINFDSSMVNLDDISQSLSMICRYNGHVPNFYSVAEHSVRVAFWVRDNGFSPEECLTALLHDASEAYIGDMVRPLKRVPEVSAKHQEIEAHICSVIHGELGGFSPHPQCVHDADKAIYEWEVEHIRTGKVAGWPPQDAKGRFLASYQNFCELVRESREASANMAPRTS